MAKKLSTAELIEKLNDPGIILVDVRPMAAYNGWQLKGEIRGGHIPGAVAFPLQWTSSLKLDELENLLESKGVTPDKTVVIYGYEAANTAAIVNLLDKMGCPNTFIYEAGLEKWAADERRPMVRLPNFEKLVYPEWLHKKLSETHSAEEHSAETPDKSLAVFHVDYGGYEDYKRGHITGAMYLDVSQLESASSGNLLSNEDLETALLSLGIRHSTRVVLYGQDTEVGPGKIRPGVLAAARAAVILMYAGVKDVRILDGGLDAWIASGYEAETKAHEPVPADSFGAVIPGNPEYIIDIEKAKELLADPNGTLVSMRSWLEFTGQRSGYDYIGPIGRIAGAVWGNSGSDANHMEHYRNPDNSMRSHPEIEDNWRAAGITPDKHIGFYCGTGWRASEAFFDAYLMGWEQTAVYDGGWFEWSQDKSNPIERGEPVSGDRGSGGGDRV